MKNQNKSGFTIIELLVVIAIIGLLASVLSLALNSARVKAREAKRKSDIVQIREALDMYYHETGQSTYPHGGTTGTPNRETDIQSLKNFLVPKYLSMVPNDPRNDPENYQYVWGNGGQDYGLFIPFSNDNGQDCMFKTAGGNQNWFKQGSIRVPDCTF